jgi:hypothetical protein
MVSGAIEKQDIRELEYEIPKGVFPPASMQRMVEKIVDVISISGHYAPLGRFEQFRLLLFQRDDKGERSLTKIYVARALGAKGNR